MTPSARIAAFIQGYEKCSLTAYMPAPDDRPTIGWGSTGPDIVMGLEWTQEQADERFAADLAKFGAGVFQHITSVTNQAQYDAMVSLAYYIGLGNFGTSTLLRLHNLSNYAGAAGQFVRWNMQAGRVLGGLTARRNAEASIYRGLT
jgi:lysozyme